MVQSSIIYPSLILIITYNMFKKYNLADNAVANLDAWINASTTTITLTLWTGVIFPASNFIGTLVQYNTPADPTSGIAKSEKVLVSSRSSDILTVTRGFDGDTGTSFLAWDFLYLNVVAEITKDIQDEVTRLENDKLDISEYNSTTRDNLTPYRLLFIDSTGAETQLALGTAWQVLISQGATNNPIWQVPSVDIAGLTEDTVWDMDIDDFVKRDGTGNKKIKLNRYRASDDEATAWTSTKKFMTPAQASMTVIPTDILLVSGWDTSTSTNLSTPQKRWEFTIQRAWTYRCIASVISTSSGWGGYTISIYIYKNGVQVATNSVFSDWLSWVISSVTSNIVCVKDDTIEAYISVSNSRSCKLNWFSINWSLFFTNWLPVNTL